MAASPKSRPTSVALKPLPLPTFQSQGGQPVDRAREILRYSSKRAAYYLDRVLLSALGNADAIRATTSSV